MIRTQYAVAGMLLVALAGCGTPEERAARAAQEAAQQEARKDAQCKSYGSRPDSDAYVNCRVQIDQSEAAINAAAAERSAAELRATGARLMNGQPTTRCTSTPFGNTIQTNCY